MKRILGILCLLSTMTWLASASELYDQSGKPQKTHLRREGLWGDETASLYDPLCSKFVRENCPPLERLDMTWMAHASESSDQSGKPQKTHLHREGLWGSETASLYDDALNSKIARENCPPLVRLDRERDLSDDEIASYSHSWQKDGKSVPEKYPNLLRFLMHSYVNTKMCQEIPNYGANRHSLSINPSNSLLVILPVRDYIRGAKGEIIIWDLAKKKLHTHIVGLPYRIVQAIITPDGNTIIAADSTHNLSILDINSLKSFDLGNSYRWDMALSEDGSTLVTNTERYIFVWNVKTGKKISEIKVPDGVDLSLTTSVAINYSGSRVAVAANDCAYVFDVATGKHGKFALGHGSRMLKINFNDTGSQLIINGVDNNGLDEKSKRSYFRSKWKISSREHATYCYDGEHQTLSVGNRIISQKDNQALVYVRDEKTNHLLCSHQVLDQFRTMLQGEAINDEWFACSSADGSKIYAWNLNELMKNHTFEKWERNYELILKQLKGCSPAEINLLRKIQKNVLSHNRAKVRLYKNEIDDDGYIFERLPQLIQDILKDYVILEVASEYSLV